MPFLDEVAFLIDNAGIATLDQDLFLSRMPFVPSVTTPVTVIRETGGTEPTYVQNSPIPRYRRPSAQLVTYAGLYVDARAVVQACYELLAAVRNQFIGSTWYLSIVPNHEPSDDLGVDPALRRAMCVLNFRAEKGATGGVIPVANRYVDFFGGDRFGFFGPPAIADQYPAGATDDDLVPGSAPIDGSTLTASYVLEANARLSQAVGSRAKVALFDVDNAPAIALPGTEIAFTVNELVGERKRSATFTIPAGSGQIAAKVTVNDIATQAAAWNVRIFSVS